MIMKRTLFYPILTFASLAAVTLSAAAPAKPAAASAGDWPCYRGPNRNGIVDRSFTLLPDGAKKLWEVHVGEGNGGIAVAGNRLYMGSPAPEPGLICLDAASGKEVWHAPIDQWGMSATPSVADGRVYALASKDVPRACCLDAATGHILWERPLVKSSEERQYGHSGSPVLWQDMVFLNAGGGAALKKDTGEPVWVHEGYAGLATPVVFSWKNKPCVAFFGGDRLIARDARSGRELFQIPWKTDLGVNACDPIIFGEKMFLCSDYGFGRALYDFSSGEPKLLWEVVKRGGHAFSSGFWHDGHIYCFTPNGFVCLDPATGEPRWEDGSGGSALLVGDKCLRIRSRGELVIARVSPAGFEKLESVELGMTEIKNAPSYSNGRLFVRNEKGRVVCLQIGTPAAPAAPVKSSGKNSR